MAEPRVRITSTGHVSETKVEALVEVDGEERWVDISRYISDVEWSLSAKKGVATAWLNAVLVSVEVEAELRQLAGTRFFVQNKIVDEESG